MFLRFNIRFPCKACVGTESIRKHISARRENTAQRIIGINRFKFNRRRCGHLGAFCINTWHRPVIVAVGKQRGCIIKLKRIRFNDGINYDGLHLSVFCNSQPIRLRLGDIFPCKRHFFSLRRFRRRLREQYLSSFRCNSLFLYMKKSYFRGFRCILGSDKVTGCNTPIPCSFSKVR